VRHILKFFFRYILTYFYASVHTNIPTPGGRKRSLFNYFSNILADIVAARLVHNFLAVHPGGLLAK